VLQPRAVQASNDLESLPQLHFCIDFPKLREEYIYIAEAQIRSVIIHSFLEFYYLSPLHNSRRN
jgi:hypothetical protein